MENVVYIRFFKWFKFKKYNIFLYNWLLIWGWLLKKYYIFKDVYIYNFYVLILKVKIKEGIVILWINLMVWF